MKSKLDRQRQRENFDNPGMFAGYSEYPSCYIVTFVLSVIRNLVSISQKNEPLLVSQITDL